MASAKKMIIKETEKEIKKLLKESSSFIGQRLRVLLILKQNEEWEFLKNDLKLLIENRAINIVPFRIIYN